MAMQTELTTASLIDTTGQSESGLCCWQTFIEAQFSLLDFKVHFEIKVADFYK